MFLCKCFPFLQLFLLPHISAYFEFLHLLKDLTQILLHSLFHPRAMIICVNRWSSMLVHKEGCLTGPASDAAAAAKSLQSCPTLCDPVDGSPPGSPVPGILQARTLERVAISFSNAWKWKVKVKFLSHVRLLATPWIAAYQAPPSMGFSRQEYWSGVPLPSPAICKWCFFSHFSLDLGRPRCRIKKWT